MPFVMFLGSTNMFSVQDFSFHLNTTNIGHNVKYYDSIDSTNIEMCKIITDNKSNTIDMIVTDYQTNGRGRLNNRWFSKQFDSITCSILIKDSIDNLELILPLSCGIAIVESIFKTNNIKCELKWPNDILYDNKKIGGILIEKKSNYFIVGLGLNVNQKKMNAEIADKSCSLRQIMNEKISREYLLAEILNILEKLINQPKEIIIKRWQELCSHINKEVYFSYGRNKLNGTFLGLSNKGKARMKIDSKIITFNSGAIQL